MVILRPVASADLGALVELSKLTGYGLTTLPTDRTFLARRIRASEEGFARREDEPARGDSYLFVLEDLRNGRIVGTCGLVSKVGGFEPFYAYRIEVAVHESKTLGVRNEIQTLHLVAEHNGPSEIGSLFLAPDYRRDGNGRLMSLARFLFIAEHPEAFDPVVIAEMRGVVDEKGGSVFWDALGRHFFAIDFPTADYLSTVDKRFIADLMPTHPIYIPLLPPEAQQVIGEVHPDTRPALRLLEAEGFRRNGMVDIFEAGPVVECARDEIRTVSESAASPVVGIGDESYEAPESLVARVAGEFRVCKARLRADRAGVHLPTRVALALGVKLGDRVRWAPFRPRPGREDPSAAAPGSDPDSSGRP